MIRILFAHITMPARSPSRRTGNPEGYRILVAEHPDVAGSALENDVPGQQPVVFWKPTAHLPYKVLYPALKIRMKVVHHSSRTNITQHQTSSAGLLEDIQNVIPLAHGVEEAGGCPKVHPEGCPKQQVRSNTGKFIHDGANVLSSQRHLNLQCFFHT